MRTKILLCLQSIEKEKGKNVEIVVIMGIIWVYEITEVSALSQHENSFGLKIDTTVATERTNCYSL